jgi:phosphopantetheine--protein transferase-like protein
MTVSIGLDLVNFNRFSELVNNNPALKSKIFNLEELTLNLRQLAGNFAVKEAFYKALEDQQLFRYHDCSILRDAITQRPIIVLSGLLKNSLIDRKIHISITNEDMWIIACVVIL